MIARGMIVRTSLLASALTATLVTAACTSDRATGPSNGFLRGTSSNHQIGIVVNATGNSLTLFQLGAPTQTRAIPLGASNTITAVGFSVRGTRAVVPLGNASSVALVDLNALAVTRNFLFASGNTTGQAFVDDTTIVVANTANGYVGRFSTTQRSDSITDTVHVAPSPTAIELASSTAYVISANLDANFTPLGNGVVTAINPRTLAVTGTVATGGTNSSAGAVGPDGKLYVVNTGDYTNPSSLTVIDLSSLSVVTTVPNVGVGAGAIAIDHNGLAYISAFSGGTVIWNTATQTFVRGPGQPVCAPLSGGGCRGAFDAEPDAAGDVYQAFFGSQTLKPYVFVYHAGTYALTDSIAVGPGPTQIRIATF